jgi:hypothetical protein
VPAQTSSVSGVKIRPCTKQHPCVDFPLALGMVETLEMTRVPCEWTALLQSFDGTLNLCSGGMNCCCSGGMNAAMGECRSVLSIPVIRRRETMTAIAIKA